MDIESRHISESDHVSALHLGGFDIIRLCQDGDSARPTEFNSPGSTDCCTNGKDIGGSPSTAPVVLPAYAPMRGAVGTLDRSTNLPAALSARVAAQELAPPMHQP